MRILLLARPPIFEHLHASVRRHGSIIAAKTPADCAASIAKGGVSCLVVDPDCMPYDEMRRVVASAATESMTLIVYTALHAESLRKAVSLTTRTDVHFVFQGETNEHDKLDNAILCASACELGAALVHHLGQEIERLPNALRTIVASMLHHGGPPTNLDGLVTEVGRSRRTVDRAVIRAGFASTRMVINAARLVRVYRAIILTRKPLKHIGLLVECASKRTLDSLCFSLTDMSAAALRRSPPPAEQLASIIASRLKGCSTPVGNQRRLISP